METTKDLNNGWRTDYPEYDGTYLVVLDDGTVTTMMYECWEGQWEEISNDGVLYWQPFPEPPRKCTEK